MDQCESMKKTLIVIGVIIALVIAYWLISPLFINKRVSEEFPMQDTQAASEKILAGSFVGFDKIHYGSGDVSVIKTDEGYIIRFEDNFDVANGPDLYVGFGKDGEYVKGSGIGRLKGNIGSQNYELPAGVYF